MTWYAAIRLPEYLDSEAAHALQSALAHLSPRMAFATDTATTTLTLDIGPLRGAQVLRMAEQIQGNVQHALDIPPAVGLAPSVRVARIVAQVIPEYALAIIAPGQEATFLAPLPITLLPIEPRLLARLRTFGLTTIGAIAQLSVVALQNQFGTAGIRLYHLAHGHMEELLPLVDTPRQIVLGQHFSGAVVSQAILEQTLHQIVPRLARRLECDGCGVQTLTLMCEPDWGAMLECTRSLPTPTSDLTLLRGTLFSLLASLVFATGIVTLRVIASDLHPTQTRQAALFPELTNSPADQQSSLVALLPPHLASRITRATIPHPQARCLEQQVAFHTLEEA